MLDGGSQLCHLLAIQTASFGPLWAFSPAAWGEDEGSQSRGSRREGNTQLALRWHGTSLSATLPAHAWEPQPCLPCLSALQLSEGEPGPSDLRASGLTTHSPACSLTSAPLTGPTGLRPSGLPTSHSGGTWPLPALLFPPRHPFVLEHIRERRELEVAFTLSAQIKLGSQLRRRRNEDGLCTGHAAARIHAHPPPQPRPRPGEEQEGAGEAAGARLPSIPVVPVGEVEASGAWKGPVSRKKVGEVSEAHHWP